MDNPEDKMDVKSTEENARTTEERQKMDDEDNRVEVDNESIMAKADTEVMDTVHEKKCGDIVDSENKKEFDETMDDMNRNECAEKVKTMDKMDQMDQADIGLKREKVDNSTAGGSDASDIGHQRTTVTETEKERSSYMTMLGNIASDLDNLLTDLCPHDKVVAPPIDTKGTTIEVDRRKAEQTTGRSGTLHCGTVDSAGTLGKDSFFSSAGNTSRRHGDAISSSHSLVSLDDHHDCDSVDSGHDGRIRTGPSPLVFDPNHFSATRHNQFAAPPAHSQCSQHSSSLTFQVEISPNMDDLRPIGTTEKLEKTNSIWLLASLSRAGAVHILKDRETGVIVIHVERSTGNDTNYKIFIVRKSSQANSLALSVHSRLSGHPAVDHYLIEGTDFGFRLQNSIHFFHSVPSLIAYYIENIDEIPYHLRLPVAIQQAKSTRELASLDLLGQDFWVSPISRKSPSPEPMSGALHKSCSEPINIQHPLRAVAGTRPCNTAPSHSASDFSHFMKTQSEMEKYFAQHSQSTDSRDVPASLAHSSHTRSATSESCPQHSLSHTSTPGSHMAYPTSPSPSNSHIISQLVTESCAIHEHHTSTMTSLPDQQSRSADHQHVQRLASGDSWQLASSPYPVTRQSSRAPSQASDIYKSNPTNQPMISVSVSHHTNYPPTPSSQRSIPDELSGSSKSRAWTHPRPDVPKAKSNLYFTTNLGLLEIPENSYFTSNLSDKLSDYEDIWKNSCAESDLDKQSVRRLNDPRSVLEAKVGTYSSEAMKPGGGKVRVGKKKVLRKTNKASPPARRASPPINRDSVTGGTTGLTALEQARMIAGCASEDEFSPTSPSTPVAHFHGNQRLEHVFETEPVAMTTSTTVTTQTVITETPVKLVTQQESSKPHSYRTSRHIQLKTSHSLDFSPPAPQIHHIESPTHHTFPVDVNTQVSNSNQAAVTTPKCVFTTTMSVIVSESSDTSSNTKVTSTVSKDENSIAKTKILPSPLSRLSRLKSSSESSLATVSSPLYAEPADAVKLRDKHGKAINIQVRRRSAPVAQNLLKDKAQSKVSQNPPLDTIFSPGAEIDSAQNAQTKFSFESPNIKYVSKPAHVARSQSMRTHDSQLQRKSSWKDRLNRLKLGTKVLARNLTPPTSIGVKNYGPGGSNLDHSVFTQEHGVQASPSSPTPGKFPVEAHTVHEIVRASCFSESSTVQDLISSAHPELSVRPIGLKPRKADPRNIHVSSTPPSEYDNLVVYRASSLSSQSTVYSPPWEGGTATKLIQQSLPPPRLPPAMDYQERVQRWQEAHSTYHEEAIIKAANGKAPSSISTVSPRTPTSSPRKESTSQSHPSSPQDKNTLQQSQQRHQLLHHQHLLKMEETFNSMEKDQATAKDMSHRPNTHMSGTPMKGHDIAQHQQQQLKKKNRLSRQDSNSKVTSQPSSPAADLAKLTLTSTTPSNNISNNNMSATVTTASTSPQRLSSHCPDVVNCHNAPLQTGLSSSQQLPASHEVVLSPEQNLAMTAALADDDVLFGGELVYASDDLQQRIKSVLSPQMTSTQKGSKNPGAKIREYIFKLSSDQCTIFGSTIENFIQCTVDSHETNPQYVMRNVRQFMTGIKNYLVKHGEGELEDLIERERNKLADNEILNIDAIIEQALHVCVLKPLKYHIYKLFVDKYSTNGALEQLSRNIKYARSRSPQDLGVKAGLTLPSAIDMEVIKHYLDLMQRSYSPLQKLQNLLKATSTIYHCVQGKAHHFPSRGPSSLGADDFLPLLIYVIVHCGLVSAEIEADFMWGLLQPSLLTGEGGYYLTTLSSAVLVLKNFQDTHQMAPTQMEGRLPTIADMQGFLKIAIPDELHGHITWKTLPVRPNMNTRDVCSLVAHKFKVTNPQDYGLFLLIDGTESQLADSDCPQLIKGDNLSAGKECHFAFKRVDANIAWPRHMKHSPITVMEI